MRRKLLSVLLLTLTALFQPAILFAQAPNLGSAASFALFTASGAFDNSGGTYILGDIGTNVGAISGFPPGTLTGLIHVADSVSALAATDVDSAYLFLSGISCDSTIGTTLGNNQVLLPKVYCLGGISTLAGDLTLDAQGDSNALFIFKINGAFTTGSSARVILINGAQMNNIYWQINGAFTLGDTSVFSGTLLVNGAISLLDSSILLGRALSRAGAISIQNNINLLPVELMAFNADCRNELVVLTWSTAYEQNNQYYAIEQSTDGLNWYLTGKIYSGDNASGIKNYSFTNNNLYAGASYYRLKQTDFDGSFEYSPMVMTLNCKGETPGSEVYPNPGKGMFNLLFQGDKDKVTSVSVINALGTKIYSRCGFQPTIDLSDYPTGIYYLYLHVNSLVLVTKLILSE